jgi:hypothetical protein
MAALALSGLALSQPAMAVRSSESLPAPGAKVQGLGNRVGSPVKKSEEFVGIPIVALLIAGVVIISTIVIVAKDNNNSNQSPG